MSLADSVAPEPPALTCRWLHGGPALDDLTSIPLMNPGGTTGSSDNAPSVWRSFTEEENERLEKAWHELDEKERERAWRRKVQSRSGPRSRSSSQSGSRSRRSSMSLRSKEDAKEKAQSAASETASETSKKGDGAIDSDEDSEDERERKERQKSYIADPEQEAQKHIVHVSQDYLFSADLLSLSLYPVFWKGARIGLQRATYFYPSTTSTSTKYYPVDPLLSFHLEESYNFIRPFDPSYGDELRRALEIGPEAESKLKHPLPVEVGVDVIWQSKDSARIYARHLPARLSKGFWTSLMRDKSHSGGGTLVYRGFDTLSRQQQPAKSTKPKPAATEKGQTLKGKASKSDLLDTSSSAVSSNSVSEEVEDSDDPSSNPTTKDGQKAVDAGKDISSDGGSKLSTLFSIGIGSGAKPAKSTIEQAGDAAEKADGNTTAEALEGSSAAKPAEDSRRHSLDGDSALSGYEHSDSAKETSEPELAHLVLVIHGIGQKLATTYDSFSIVHAINQLRKLCNKQMKDKAIREIIGNQRIQFIPLQWRSSLQFEDEEEDGSDEDEERNVFTLDDIQVQGSIPFVRELVTGVALDAAFYMSHHRERMTKAVVRDANAIYRLFCQRNPNFKGKVSLIAHSLGTALATDILSSQPTFVPDLKDLSREARLSNEHLLFNTSTMFFLGSPAGYMFFLNRGHIVARKGRERGESVPAFCTHDKVGKYGCMAVDSLYNIYNVVDPVACCLNACVDRDYARAIQPLSVTSVTASLLHEHAPKSASFFGSLIPSFGSGSASSTNDKGTQAQNSTEGETKSGQAQHPDPNAMPQAEPPARPKSRRQITSQLTSPELHKFHRAEAKMLALNPQGSIDYYLAAEGFSQYYDMLLSHASYWTDPRFATFVLTQLLASEEMQKKAKERREEQTEKEAEKERGKEEIREAAKKKK